MPAGLVRSGDFRNGTPITLPHDFGNDVAGVNEPFGNVIPQSNPRMVGNPVDWLPSPAHFGNQVSFLLQTVPSVVIVIPGSTGTVDINLTNLKGSNSAELTYFGEPSGVTLSFSTNPDISSSTVTVTVPSDVPVGKYTITIVGTVSSPNIEYVQLHLVVADTVNQSNGGVSVVNLSSAQLLTLNSIPVEVVPGVPGFIPIIESGYMVYTAGTTPYSVNADDAIALYVGDDTQAGSIINYGDLPATQFIDVFNPDQGIYFFAPSYQWTNPNPSVIPHAPTASLAGRGMYLAQYRDFPTGVDWTGGNGTLKIVVEYNYVGA